MNYKLLFILSVDARPHRASQTTRRRTCPCLRMRRRPQPAESSSSTMDTGLWLDKKVKEELMNGWKNIINLPTCICKFYAIDIDLISSNYSMYGLVVGMYGSVMEILHCGLGETWFRNYFDFVLDKPQKLTRRQRRERRMDQKKAEMEYRKKMEVFMEHFM